MDRDVVNLIHYLRWNVTVDWGDAHSWLFCDEDTPVDARSYLTDSGDQLPDSLRNFVLAVDKQLKDFPDADFVFGYPLFEKPRRPGDSRLCFVAMPYGFDWFNAVKQAIIDAGTVKNFQCVVSLDMATAGQIVGQIWQQLRQAEVIVADLSHSNANVYYEVGLAHALGKKIIFITQGNDKLPFDVSTSRCIRYEENNLNYLKSELEKAFGAVPQRYAFDPHPYG